MNKTDLEHTIYKRFKFDQFDIRLLEDIEPACVIRQKLKWFKNHNRGTLISHNVFKLHKQKLIIEYINKIKRADFALLTNDELYDKFKVPKYMRYMVSNYLNKIGCLHIASTGYRRYFSSINNKHLKPESKYNPRNTKNESKIEVPQEPTQIEPCPFLNPGMYQRMYGHLKEVRLPSISINPMDGKWRGEITDRNTNY